jgi:hypothetical protein
MTSTDLVHFKPFGIPELPFRVLEHAYHRPQAAKLGDRYALSTLPESKPVDESRFKLTQRTWYREESWINHAVEGLLASLPTSVARDWVANLCDGFILRDGQTSQIEYAGLRAVTGDPDFILVGQDSVVLAESKVSRHRSNGRYTFDQYSKYMRLAALCRVSSGKRLPGQVVHLLLVPSMNPEEFVGDYQDWEPTIVGHRLLTDPSNVRLRSKGGQIISYAQWFARMAETLQSREVQQYCPCDPDALSAILANETESFAQTYVWSWGDAMALLSSRCGDSDLDRQAAAARLIGELASGA